METLIMIGVILAVLVIVVVLYKAVLSKGPHSGHVEADTGERNLVLREPKKNNDVKVVRFDDDDRELAEMARNWEGSTSGYERVYKGGSIARVVENIIIEEADKRAKMMQGGHGAERNNVGLQDDNDGHFIGYRPKGDVRFVSDGVHSGNEENLRDCLIQLKDINPALYDLTFDHYGWERDNRTFDNAVDKENYQNVYSSLKKIFKGMSESEIARYVKETYEDFDKLRQSNAGSSSNGGDEEGVAEKPAFLEGF